MSSERRRPRLRLLGPLVMVVLLLALASLPLFVLPAVDEPEDVRGAPVDAVLVLGGGEDERIGTATALLPRLPDPPPVLLLSVPYGEPLLTCGSVPTAPDVDARCLLPTPFTTSGEAAVAVTMAAEQGWRRLVVVTSDYHVTRARVLFSRCAERLAPDLRVLWVAGDTEPLTPRGLWRIATEWPSLLASPWDHQPVCTGEPDFPS